MEQEKNRRHRRVIGVAWGTRTPPYLNVWHIMSFCAYERQCPKQNTVARLKSKDLAPSKFWTGYATEPNYNKSFVKWFCSMPKSGNGWKVFW